MLLLAHSFHHFWLPIYVCSSSSPLSWSLHVLDSLINLWAGNNLWYVVILHLHEDQDCTFLKIIHQHNIEVVAFYETRSTLLHSLCYGFWHLFLFKIKINFTMPWTRIRFIWWYCWTVCWDKDEAYLLGTKTRWAREHFLEILYSLIPRHFNTDFMWNLC